MDCADGDPIFLCDKKRMHYIHYICIGQLRLDDGVVMKDSNISMVFNNRISHSYSMYIADWLWGFSTSFALLDPD